MSSASPRKRRRPAAAAAVGRDEEEFRALSARDPRTLTKEEQKRLRAIKNRRSAQRSRDRVRNEIDSLKSENDQLRAHVAQLSAMLATRGAEVPPPPPRQQTSHHASSPDSPQTPTNPSLQPQRRIPQRQDGADAAAPASRFIASIPDPRRGVAA